MASRSIGFANCVLLALAGCSASSESSSSETLPQVDSSIPNEVISEGERVVSEQIVGEQTAQSERDAREGRMASPGETREGLQDDLSLDATGEGSSESEDEMQETQPQVPSGVRFPDAGCEELASDPNINWHESSLQTDQQIVACLALSLGNPVGFGENARGGFDPQGNSKLVVITQNAELSVEEQVLDAISGDEPAWIVFDKNDFSDDFEIGMYRLQCANAEVLTRLDATEQECREYGQWCSRLGINTEQECLEAFFNQALNDGDLPIRNPVIGSNKTLDGRMSNAYFRFSGFAIGADSSGEPTQTSQSVILTHLSFIGAGHTEDHELDPDMIRSTGGSQDIWIHKNDFDLTGDSAFDVKVGAHDITISFNRVTDVVRASLHGSNDSREINAQITTTIHNNAFVTRDERYLTLGNTGRRLPLIRRGTSHMWNNVFVNYRKDVLSVRVGAQLLWEDNVFLVKQSLQEKNSLQDSLDELSSNLIRDIERGNFRAEGTFLWFSNAQCELDDATQVAIAPSFGTVEELSLRYSTSSQTTMSEVQLAAGQQLVDYVSSVAGKTPSLPFNSPFAADFDAVLAQLGSGCP